MITTQSVWSNQMVMMVSTITCPVCGSQHKERMPDNRCQLAYECPSCHTTLRPRPGDCCVFCSYGSVPCPAKQTNRCSPA